MLKHLLALTTVVLATLPAQTCPERALGVAVGTGDDTMFPIQSIGFAFPFAGTTYTDVHICANGYFFLSNAGLPAPSAGDYSSTQIELASQSPRICVLWNDLNLTPANSASVYINSTPTRCTITWDRAVNYGLTTQFQMQAQLFPSGEVRLFWSDGATNNSTYNFAAGSGIVGVSPGLGAVLPAASDLSAGSVTPDNLLFEHWTVQGSFDLPLRSLQLIPTSPGWVYVPTPWSGCATKQNYGTGCVGARDSMFEIMPASGFDLANSTISLLRSGTGYTAYNGIVGTFVPPSGTALVIANLDDTVQVVTLTQAMPVPGGTTTQLAVSSNGNIALSGIGNGAGFAPDVGNFLAFAQTSVAAAWHDYNPAAAGSGKIFFEQVGSVAYVTWNDVYSYLTTSPDRFQYQFNLATGDITIVYEVCTTGSNDYLVGYSRGGASPRPEESDLSVALATAVTLADVGVQGLTLTGSGLPILGTSTFAFAISQVPNLVPLSILFVGDQAAPGIDLTFLGMPGCFGYTNANLTSLTVPVVLPAGTGNQPLPIPASLSLIGTTLTAQAAAFSLATPLNLVTSNGTQISVGL